jgi:hypothetical protein
MAEETTPWEQIFSELNISPEWIDLISSPQTYWPGMADYADEFKDVNIARGGVQDILSKLLGGEDVPGSIAGMKAEKTGLLTGAYGTSTQAAEEAKELGLLGSTERFRAGSEAARYAGGRDVGAVREAGRDVKHGFGGFGALKEKVGTGIKDIGEKFGETMLGLTTARSHTEQDIKNLFGTRMEDIERTRESGMFNVRDLVERMKSGGSDALMELINSYMDVRNQILSRGGGKPPDTTGLGFGFGTGGDETAFPTTGTGGWDTSIGF